MTNDTRWAPGGRQRAQHPCFLFGAKEAGVGAEYRGVKQRFPYWCSETEDQQDDKPEVTVEPKTTLPQGLLQAKTAFVRIACTSCPLSNCPPLLAPFPLNIWEEDQGLYK